MQLPRVVAVLSLAWLALAACTSPDDRTVDVRLTATACTEAGDGAASGSCTTCTTTWPVATDDGDPTLPDDGYDPDDDAPLTPVEDDEQPVPVLSDNAVQELVAALGGQTARMTGGSLIGAEGGTGDDVLYDAPGCNGYPDTVCTTHCCALHDICYDKNNCTWASWCGVEGKPCSGCNVRVAQCILKYGLYGCQIPLPGVPAPCSTWKCGCNQHECYDARTNKHYCAASC